jgi:hypothetical protein
MKRANPDAFTALLTAQRAVYEAEIRRLADHYRLRILSGEFCGGDGTGPRYMALETELQGHPWLATKQGRITVVACSHRVTSGDFSAESGATENEYGDGASECLTFDVMREAAARKWIKPETNGDDEFELRVA